MNTPDLAGVGGSARGPNHIRDGLKELRKKFEAAMKVVKDLDGKNKDSAEYRSGDETGGDNVSKQLPNQLRRGLGRGRGLIRNNPPMDSIPSQDERGSCFADQVDGELSKLGGTRTSVEVGHEGSGPSLSCNNNGDRDEADKMLVTGHSIQNMETAIVVDHPSNSNNTVTTTTTCIRHNALTCPGTDSVDSIVAKDQLPDPNISNFVPHTSNTTTDCLSKSFSLPVIEITTGTTTTCDDNNRIPIAAVPAVGKTLQSLVLHQVFKYLDQQSLGVCRRVCKFWNQEVIPVYADRNWIDFGFYYQSFDPREAKLRMKHWNQTMKVASPGLVGKLKIQFEFLKLKPFQHWLFDFGPFLTSLIINGPFLKPIVFRILIGCPNLTKLALGNITSHMDEFTEFLQPVPLPDLKLKEVKFVGGSVTVTAPSTNQSFFIAQDENVNALIEIVQACPQLETLITEFGDSFNSFATFVEGISSFHRVTRNLVKWVIGEYRSMPPLLRHIHPLEEIEFSNRLKFIHIHNIVDTIWYLQNGRFVSQTCLERILGRVSSSLETLILSGPYFVATHLNNSQSSILQHINLPQMKCLKVFQTLSMDQYRLQSFGFVKQLPSLEKLFLYSAYPDFFRSVFQHPENISVIENPHRNLKELRLAQALSLPSEMILVAKIFPNLTKLGLRFGIAELGGTQHCFLKQFLQIFQHLPHLESLGLELLGLYNPFKIHEELTDVFDTLNCLKSVTLISHTVQPENSQVILRQIIHKDTILKTICRARKLRRLTLINFVMPLKDAIDIKCILQSKNISLNIGDNDYYNLLYISL